MNKTTIEDLTKQLLFTFIEVHCIEDFINNHLKYKMYKTLKD